MELAEVPYYFPPENEHLVVFIFVRDVLKTIMAVGAQNDLGGQQTFARKMT